MYLGNQCVTRRFCDGEAGNKWLDEGFVKQSRIRATTKPVGLAAAMKFLTLLKLANG